MVGWIFERINNAGGSRAKCINDAFVIPLATSADATWGAALQSVAEHTVQIRGTIQQVFILPRTIS